MTKIATMATTTTTMMMMIAQNFIDILKIDRRYGNSAAEEQ
jgi:hypothetical protein